MAEIVFEPKSKKESRRLIPCPAAQSKKALEERKKTMKKLMFGMAVAAAGLAFGLESANVVGYDQTGLRSGNKGAGAAFVPVNGATTIDLQDITVAGYDVADGSDGDVSAQTLDQFGRTVNTYSWVDVIDGEDVFHGWYDDNGDLVEGMTFMPGEGLYVNAASAAFSLQSAGQVPTSDISVQLRSGNKHVVNPTPVTLDIQAIWVSGYNAEDGSDGDVSAQTLDQFGRTIDTYSWVDVADGEDIFYGWYDDNGDLVEDVTVTSGTSLYYNAPSAVFYVNFPGVTL